MTDQSLHLGRNMNNIRLGAIRDMLALDIKLRYIHNTFEMDTVDVNNQREVHAIETVRLGQDLHFRLIDKGATGVTFMRLRLDADRDDDILISFLPDRNADLNNFFLTTLRISGTNDNRGTDNIIRKQHNTHSDDTDRGQDVTVPRRLIDIVVFSSRLSALISGRMRAALDRNRNLNLTAIEDHQNGIHSDRVLGHIRGDNNLHNDRNDITRPNPLIRKVALNLIIMADDDRDDVRYLAKSRALRLGTDITVERVLNRLGMLRRTRIDLRIDNIGQLNMRLIYVHNISYSDHTKSINLDHINNNNTRNRTARRNNHDDSAHRGLPRLRRGPSLPCYS